MSYIAYGNPYALHTEIQTLSIGKSLCKNRYVIEIKRSKEIYGSDVFKVLEMLMWSGFYIRRFDFLSPNVFLLYNKTYKGLGAYLCNPVSIGISKMLQELLIIHFKLEWIIWKPKFSQKGVKVHNCPICGEKTEGTYSEGGTHFNICEQCYQERY